MVDPATLTTLLTPFLRMLSKGSLEVAKGTASEIGKDGWQKIKQVWQAIWSKAEQRPSLKEALEDATATPDDPDSQAALRLQLKKLLADDPELVATLTEILSGDVTPARNAKRDVATNVQVIGDNNTTKTVGDVSAGGDVSF